MANVDVKKTKVNKVLEHGMHDSFFAGEEFKDLEEMNPNIDMGFSKFRFDPGPDFIQQMYSESTSKMNKTYLDPRGLAEPSSSKDQPTQRDEKEEDKPRRKGWIKSLPTQVLNGALRAVRCVWE